MSNLDEQIRDKLSKKDCFEGCGMSEDDFGYTLDRLRIYFAEHFPLSLYPFIRRLEQLYGQYQEHNSKITSLENTIGERDIEIEENEEEIKSLEERVSFLEGLCDEAGINHGGG